MSNEFRFKNAVGFTLIEVLIALAIISIALTAVIKVTSQSIQNTTYIQNKTIANWVGEQVMNEVLVGILKLSDADQANQETTFLGKKFLWQAKIKDTPNPKIKEIDVDVSLQSQPLIQLVSYEYLS